MARVYTTGVINPETGVKDFEVKHKGKTAMAYREGTKYRYNGHVGTLKSIKAIIVADILNEDESPIKLGGAAEKEEPAATMPRDQWSSCDPAALLVLQLLGVPVSSEIIEQTLDCFGYIEPSGNYDASRAARELKRAEAYAKGEAGE